MTIKSAISIAIDIISCSNTPEKEEVIRALLLCSDNLYKMKWTKELVFDACDQFIMDNQRNLTTRDFELQGLPRHTTIKYLFGMTAAEFRDTYYPLKPTTRTVYSPYGDIATEELIDQFIAEFNRIEATSAEDFDKRYDKTKCPCWRTIAKYCGVNNSWSKLLKQLNLVGYKRHKKSRKKKTYQVITNSELLKKVN